MGGADGEPIGTHQLDPANSPIKTQDSSAPKKAQRNGSGVPTEGDKPPDMATVFSVQVQTSALTSTGSIALEAGSTSVLTLPSFGFYVGFWHMNRLI